MTKQEGPAAPISDFRLVELYYQPVELYKVLKFEGLVGSGGEAKTAISEGLVMVNGNIETQKRKKIVPGDTIEYGDEKLVTVLASKDLSSNQSVIPKREKPKDALTKHGKKRAAIVLAKRDSFK